MLKHLARSSLASDHRCKNTFILKTKDAYSVLINDDSLHQYQNWKSPTLIVSDGAYGVSGFYGDPKNPTGLAAWYKPHIQAWSRFSKSATVLYFWNTEIGWASVHPVLEQFGWKYVGCNIWNKGVGHIAGNVNTKTARRFPVVTEVCAQYFFDAAFDGMSLQKWMSSEWKRSGLNLRQANEACGVKHAASRKYLSLDDQFYMPRDAMRKLVNFANERGRPEGKPYFSLDGRRPLDADLFCEIRPAFNCPFSTTNVWSRPSLRGKERVKNKNGKVFHGNQKPLDLMARLILSATGDGDIVWEPFGGLFSVSLAASHLRRCSFAAENNCDIFKIGKNRFSKENRDVSLHYL